MVLSVLMCTKWRMDEWTVWHQQTLHKVLNAHNTYEDPVLTMVFKPEFRRWLSGVPRARFVCNKTAAYTFDKFNCIFYFPSHFCASPGWVYSQCKSRIRKLCFLLNLPKYFISLNYSLRFKTSYFIFAPRMHVTSHDSAKIQLVTNLGQTLTVWRPLV